MKDLDEELTARIKAVFENIDDGMHDQGWALLREKFPEKPNRKIPAWWFSGIAASLLLIASYWAFFDSATDPITKTQDQPAVQEPNLSVKNDPPTAIKPPQDSKKQQNLVKQKFDSPVVERSFETVKNQKKQTGIPAIAPKQVGPEITIPSPLGQSNSLAIAQKVDTVRDVSKIKVVEENTNHPVSTVAQTKKTTAEFLAEQSQLAAQQGSQKEKSATKNSLEVFTGTFLNYAGSNEAKLNAGFGLNANIQVGKKLYLSVGAGISQNKLTYDANQAENLDRASSSAVVMGTNPNYMLVSTHTFVEKSVDARLLNLDLPITVKFYPTKSQNFYISTGINSNSYLAQRYDYNYKLTNAGVNGGQPTYYEETDKRKLNGFSFANSAIFAIGINQSLGKNNSLILEPYFKPALGYMGVNRLKINMAGINLKFNFSKQEKK